MRQDNTVAWARFIIAAALDDEDVNPFLELARRSGADMTAVERLVSDVDNLVRKRVVDEPSATHDEPLLSVEDLGDLEKFGISH